MANNKTSLTLPFDLACKIFGLYVHGAGGGDTVDLSMFKSWMVFYDEIVSRLQTLTKEEKELLMKEMQ